MPMWAHHQDIVSPQRKYISIAPFPTTNLQIEHSSFEVSKISSLEHRSIRVEEVGCRRCPPPLTMGNSWFQVCPRHFYHTIPHSFLARTNFSADFATDMYNQLPDSDFLVGQLWPGSLGPPGHDLGKKLLLVQLISCRTCPHKFFSWFWLRHV